MLSAWCANVFCVNSPPYYHGTCLRCGTVVNQPRERMPEAAEREQSEVTDGVFAVAGHRIRFNDHGDRRTYAPDRTLAARSQPGDRASKMPRARLAAVLTVVVALSILAAPAGLGAAPQGQPSRLNIETPINLTADEVIADNTGTGLVARGHVVVTSGVDRATADLMRFNRPARTAELIGHAQVTNPQGRASADRMFLHFTSNNQVSGVVLTGNAGLESPKYALSADQINADRGLGHVVAQGNVTAFFAPDMIVTGERATYDQRRQYATVTGHPVVSNKAGRLRGNWFELFRATNRAVIHGPVEAEVYDATITGADATIDFKRSTAVFTRHVVVMRRHSTLWADRLTIYYDVRRITAQGTTHVKFNDFEEDTAP